MTRRRSETFAAPLAVVACLCAGVAWAEKPTHPDRFRAMVEGKSFDFGVGGVIYGRELYLPGNQVVWDDIDGTSCRYGKWYAQNREICFVYEDQPGIPKCWHFFESDSGTHGLDFVSNDSDMRRYLMFETNEPMRCTGPQVGV